MNINDISIAHDMVARRSELYRMVRDLKSNAEKTDRNVIVGTATYYGYSADIAIAALIDWAYRQIGGLESNLRAMGVDTDEPKAVEAPGEVQDARVCEDISGARPY